MRTHPATTSTHVSHEPSARCPRKPAGSTSDSDNPRRHRPRVNRALLAEAVLSAITATAQANAFAARSTQVINAGTDVEWRYTNPALASRAAEIVTAQAEAYMGLAHLLYPEDSPHVGESGWAFVDALRAACSNTGIACSGRSRQMSAA